MWGRDVNIYPALLRAFPMSFFLLDRPEIQDGNHGPSDYPRVDSNGRMQRLGSTTSIIAQHSSQQYRSADVESARTNSSVFRGILGAPIMHPGTMASWASEASSAPRPPLSQNQLVETRLPSHAGGRPNISGPMLSGGILHAQGSGRGRDMRTVSLQMAAGQERARVDAVFEREEESRRQELGGGSEVFETPRTIASFAGLPTSIVDSRYSQSTLPRNPVLPRVSAVANLRGEYQDIVAPQNEIPQDEVPQNGVQRGYRNTYSTEDDDMTRYTYSQTGFTLTPAPRSMPQRSMVEDGGQRVLFMNGIEYDNPALVHSLVSGQDEIARSTGRYTPRSIGVLRRSPSAPAGPPPQREIPELPNSCSGSGSGRLAPILSRKRPTKMRDSSRALFPLGQPEFPSPPRGKGARTAITTVTAPPPQPDQPLPTSPLEKVRKSVPPPILVLPPRHSSLGPPRSAVENAITPTTPAPPTPYETAKAWIASVAPVAKNEGPVLVDIPNRRSGPENMAVSPIDSPDAPRDSVAIDNVEIPTEPTTVSEETRRLSLVPMNSPHHPSISSVLAENPEEIVVDFHKGMSFLNSPPVEENEGEEESAPSLTTAASSHSSPRARRRRSFPSPTAFSVDLEHDNNFPISPVYTDASESQSPSSAGFSESVIISDLEDAMELEEMHLRHQRLVPHRFKLGDKIPTFYGRRKQLPAPLGTVPPKGRPISQVHQKRISSIMEPPLSSAVRIQTRLTMLTSKQQVLAAVPSDPSRDSLIQQLEFEVSQQETQWMGMRQTLCLEDPLSPFDSLDSKQLSQRRTSVAKLQIGLERRLSIALTSATTDTTATGSVGGWQKQLADAQIEYLQQVPQLSKSVEMLRLVESESESELGSEIDDEFEMEIIEPLPSTVYVNPTIVLSPVLASPKSEGETDMYDEIMPLDVCSQPKAGLWRAPPVVLPEINAGTCLWDNAQLYTTSCRSCALPPAAIAVRPQKRFDVAPMQLETRRTWQKPRAPVVREQTGLWRDPNFRPKSIISNHRRGSSAKRRVAFVEEVVTGSFPSFPRSSRGHTLSNRGAQQWKQRACWENSES